MKTVDIAEAATALAQLLELVAQGEEVLISEAGIPLAMLVPVWPNEPGRELGMDKGRVTISADFDAPLADPRDYFG
jgi:antitoxin (DNA-binding transcriptional repressor) of toxin-antitoxin stability system